MSVFKKKKGFSKAELRILPILAQQAEYLKSASSILLKMTESNDAAEWVRCEKEIKQYEVKDDAIMSELYSTFYDPVVPVVDRDDFQMISSDIDIFLDQINSSAKAILLYKPNEIAPQFIEMARYIDMSAESVRQIVANIGDIMKNFTEITRYCESITELEHATDEVYEDYISLIFSTEKDAINLVKNKNMAEAFEASTDNAKDFSDHIRMFLFRIL